MSKGSEFLFGAPDVRLGPDAPSLEPLTDFDGDSHHLYFTNSGWYDDGSRLLVVGNHAGATNLYGLHLGSRTAVQLTDEPAETDRLMFSSLNPRRPEAYFWRSRDLVAIDIKTFAERVIYTCPSEYRVDMTSVTCDGLYVCTAICEDPGNRFELDLLNGYVGMQEYWSLNPHSQVLLIDVENGGARSILEKRSWIGHVNASPAVPHLATYCHEGPWESVDNRIWGIDLRDGRSWQIRPRQQGEMVGHEYWLADGHTVGFHGRYADGTPFYGTIRADGTRHREWACGQRSMHIHSNGEELIIGDGDRKNPALLAWRVRKGVPVRPEQAAGNLEGPVTILRHGCSFATQARHTHPRLSPDGTYLIFVSDAGGKGRLYKLPLEKDL
jgi:oligogalacturonide lyase